MPSTYNITVVETDDAYIIRSPIKISKKQVKFFKERDGMVIVLNIPNTIKQAIHSAVKAQFERYASSDIDLLPPDDYHITLFYFQDQGKKFSILQAAEILGEELPSLKVSIGGLIRFSKVTSEGKTALAAQIDAREIQKFRLLFQERLAAVDVSVDDEHGFTPHMTVAYVPQDLDITIRLPKLTFQVTKFSVWIGADRKAYELNQDKVVRSVQLIVDRYKGGPGSGHYGHAGRPGHRGGSLPGSVAMSIRSGKDAAERQAAAAGRKAANAAKKKRKLSQLDETTRKDKIRKLGLQEHEKYAADEVFYSATKNNDLDSVDYVLQAYEYRDEKTGYYTEVGYIGANPDSNKIRISGNVYNADGEPVGNFVRIVKRDGEVHNDYFRLDSQGTGFGKRFYQHQEEVNLAAGMKETTIYANLDVGGYAWAKMGYDFADDSYRVNVGTRLFNSWVSNSTEGQNLNIALHTGGRTASLEAYTALVDMRKTFESMRAWEMAAYTTSDGQRIGKQALLGSGWEAVKVLDENSDGWNVGQIYYNR